MRIICALGLIVTIGGGLFAQEPGGVVKRDPQTLERFENQIFGALFAGIRLSAVQDSAAHAAIRESLVKREMLDATGAAFREQLRALVEARDTRIRQLLQTEEDRASFDANAKKPIFMLDGVIRSTPGIDRE
jgi:hypothetical protein